MTGSEGARKGAREAIFEACDRHLFAHHRIPTYEELRKALGGTGSNATLSRYRGEWEAMLAERIGHSEQRPEVPDHLWEAVVGIWDAAVAAARDTAKQELEQAHEIARKRVADADTRARAAEDQATGTKQQLDALVSRLDRADKQRNEDQELIGALRGKLSATDQRLVEAKQQADAEAAGHARTRQQLDELREAARSEATAREAAHTAAMDKLMKELDAERVNVQRVQKRLDAELVQTRDERDKATWQVVDLTARNKALAEQLAGLQASLVATRTEMQDQAAAIKAQHETVATALRAELATLRAERDEARQTAAEQRSVLSTMREQRDSYERLIAAHMKQVQPNESGTASTGDPLEERN